jgi:hypothetical protein
MLQFVRRSAHPVSTLTELVFTLTALVSTLSTDTTPASLL